VNYNIEVLSSTVRGIAVKRQDMKRILEVLFLLLLKQDK
jgi:hypothetical protein